MVLNLPIYKYYDRDCESVRRPFYMIKIGKTIRTAVNASCSIMTYGKLLLE